MEYVINCSQYLNQRPRCMICMESGHPVNKMHRNCPAGILRVGAGNILAPNLRVAPTTTRPLTTIMLLLTHSTCSTLSLLTSMIIMHSNATTTTRIFAALVLQDIIALQHPTRCRLASQVYLALLCFQAYMIHSAKYHERLPIFLLWICISPMVVVNNGQGKVLR